MIPAGRGETARLALRIWGTDAPKIELAVGDHDDGHRCRADLTVRQGRVLYAGLGGVLDAVEDTRPLPPHTGWPITGRRPK